MKKLFTIFLAVVVLGTCATADMSAKKRTKSRSSSGTVIKNTNNIGQSYSNNYFSLWIESSNGNRLEAELESPQDEMNLVGEMKSDGRVVMWEKEDPDRYTIVDGYFYSTKTVPYGYFRGKVWDKKDVQLNQNIN